MAASLPPAGAASVLRKCSNTVDAVTASSASWSDTVDWRVKSFVQCEKDGLLGGRLLHPKAFRDGCLERTKSLLSSAPSSSGVQIPSCPSADRRYSNFRSPGRCGKAHSKSQVFVGTPFKAFPDPELHTVLELASDAELLDVSNILYGKSLLSPLLKSFTPGDGSVGYHDGQPPKDQADRDALMLRLEARFLFLAADAKAILSGQRPSYRNVLLQVRKKLQIRCLSDLSTEDIESEIFLHLLQQFSSGKPTTPPQAFQKVLKSGSVGAKKTRRRHFGLPSMMKLRSKELLSTVLKGGGAVTVSTLQSLIFKKLSGKLLVETVRYQLAKEAVVKTGQVAAMLETRVAVLAAKQGLVGAAKRYITVRSALSILGPMVWGTLLADMLISAVGTDYARVLRAIYAFAQIRLVRAYRWENTNQIF